MSEQTRTFHESWYRIATQRICLKPSVKVRRLVFRGQPWYVLSDAFSNDFFRINPDSYAFVARLKKNRTVEEVWKQMMSTEPDSAPGQEDVIQLLSQLYHANLLQYNISADSTKLFERHTKRKQRVLRSNLTNIMFFRIPLFDPDVFLKRALKIVRLLYSPLGGLVWGAVVIAGIKVVIENFPQLQIQSQGILAPSNLFLLYVGVVIIKAFHEFGHAFAVRAFGGEVHTIGVMFLIFSPLPYMDASAAWNFRSKYKRMFVGAAGMINEIFIAACATLVWGATGPGLVHSLAYNMLFAASVSTVLFNINPLLRYDGYYILSDLLDIPNLHSQASQELLYLVERYAFGCAKAQNPASTRKEAWILSSFGVLSGIYRIFVFSAILLFVADRFLLAGIIMAVICAVAWVIVPFVQVIRYLATTPRLERTRGRAIAVCLGVFLTVFGFLNFFPFPLSFSAPGVLKAHEYVVVVNKVNGFIDEIIAVSRSEVRKGDPLIRLSNEELPFQMQQVQAKLQEIQALYLRALQERQADLKPLETSLEAIRKQKQRLIQDQEDLVVKAEISGTWEAPLENYVGMWLVRGTPVGQIINDKTFYFSSVISQQEVSWIFSNQVRKSEVKLSGQSDIKINAEHFTIIPMAQTALPSVALGWGGHGEVAINTKDTSGKTAAEPFYELRADVALDTAASLLHGRSGRIRFQLGSQPLLQQWWRKIRQLIQKRYNI